MDISKLTATEVAHLAALTDTFKEAYEQFDIAPTLGSCQYKSIEDTANFATGIIQTFGFDKFLQIFPEIRMPDEIPTKEQFAALLLTELTEMVLDIQDDDWKAKVQRDIDRHYPPDDTPTIDAYYNCTRSIAGDLWSATILPFSCITENPLNMPVHQGPMLNMLAWGENETIGFEIAIAMHLYGTELSLYAGYDT